MIDVTVNLTLSSFRHHRPSKPGWRASLQRPTATALLLLPNWYCLCTFSGWSTDTLTQQDAQQAVLASKEALEAELASALHDNSELGARLV